MPSTSERFWSAIDTAGPAGLDRGPRPGVQSAERLGGVLDGLLAPVPGASGDFLRAVALLWHDHLDAAHALVQAREGDPDADLIHALLHRREGDFGNARYWFAQVGTHAVFPVLAQAAAGLGLPDLLRGGAWDPDAMVEAVRRACAGQRDAAPLRACQGAEFRAVAAHLLAS